MIDLQQLGFTKEELQQRVIDQLCGQVMDGVSYDEEGEAVGVVPSSFARKLDAAVQKRIDETISAIAEKHVLPNVSAYIENLSLQETTKWGEKKGVPLSFVEYLVARAEAYMTEHVNRDGKTRGEVDSYNWKSTQTRLAHLIDQYLHNSISTAMEGALKIANSQIANGIEETVKLKLAEISTALSVTTTTKKK